MWSDQIERQKQIWNFDFEHLKPIDPVQTNPAQHQTMSPTGHTTDLNAEMMNSQHSTRFQWSQISTKCNPFYNEKDASSHVLATFNKQELNETEDYETEEEEDDALVVPMFYKYQRRAKMNQEQNRIKIIQMATAVTSSNAFTKLNNSAKSTACSKKRVTRSNKKNTNNNSNNNNNNAKKLHKPQARRPSLTLSAQSNLIITFSENRKDTLRSAASTTTTTATNSAILSSNSAVKQSKNLADLFANTSKSIEANKVVELSGNKCDLAATSSQSAFKPHHNMKQQSLLDMLKHRKRKTSVNTSSAKSMPKQAVSVSSISHNLRPRTTSMN